MRLLALSNAIPLGLFPTVIVASTALVDVLITDTVLSFLLVTYMRLLALSNAMPIG